MRRQDDPPRRAARRQGHSCVDPHGGLILDHANFEIDLPARVALISDGSAAASLLARIVAGASGDFSGVSEVGGRNLSQLPPIVAGRRIAYAGVDPILFPGTIRDNLVYGLRFRPVQKSEENEREAARRIAEALKTGNPDRERPRPLDRPRPHRGQGRGRTRPHPSRSPAQGSVWAIRIYRFGLPAWLDPQATPSSRRAHRRGAASPARDLPVERHGRSRRALRSRALQRSGDDRRKHPLRRADLAPADRPRARRRCPLPRHPRARGILGDLVTMGLRIAETMSEIFRGLPPGHPLFEQFSFIGAEELPSSRRSCAAARRATGRRTAARTVRAFCPCRSAMSSRGTASGSSTTA